MLAADPVHDLQVLLARRGISDEVKEVVGLARETKGVQAPEHEGPVANPGVAVVPVALAADRLGQRGRRRREQRSCRAVGESLERQGAPLQVALPWVLREFAAVDPFPPEVGRPLHALESLLHGGRGRVLGPVLLAGRVPRARPHHRHVRTLALTQRLGRVRAGALEADPQVGHEPDRDLVLASAGDRLVVAGSAVLPPGVRLSVIEDRLAVERQLDLADDASSRPQEDVLRLVVGRRPAIGARAALAVIPGSDAHRVADDQPARARAPGGLQDERPRQVAAAGGDLHACGPEAEAPSSSVEDRREDTRAVGARQAHPLHAAAGRDEAVDLAVGQERVLRDRWKRARDPQFVDLRPDLGDRHLPVAVQSRRDRLA